MSTNAPHQPTYIIPPPTGPNWRTPLLIGVIVLLAASNIYLFTQVERVKTDNKNDMAKLSADLNGAVEKMRIDSSADVQRSRRTVETLQAQLQEQRRAAGGLWLSFALDRRIDEIGPGLVQPGRGGGESGELVGVERRGQHPRPPRATPEPPPRHRAPPHPCSPGASRRG